MSVRTEIMTLPGAAIQGENPLPMFRRTSGFNVFKTKGEFPDSVAEDLGNAPRILPYRMQDRYSRSRPALSLKTIVMENEYLKATFVPEYGGRLWSLFDKVQNRELLMANPVLQPGNLAIRNAWLSGGIEWNFGAIGHTYFTCDNVWTAILKDENGEEFVRIYEFERAKENVWQADFHLPAGSRQLFSHIKVQNPSRTDSTTYWWTNIAIPEDGKTRVLSSSDMVVVVCDNLTYEKLPYLSVMEGDLSYPSNASRAFDYFFQPPEGVKTTWEGGANKDGYVFYDRSTAPLLYHKMFCWGNHRGGDRWQEFLSRPGDGAYVEIQAGFARSQMHDKPFPAGQVLEWTQCYGGAKLDPETVHGVSLEEANNALGAYVDSVISEEELLRINEVFCANANMTVSPCQIVHAASGWGALELQREAAAQDKALPASMCFPKSSLGTQQYPWLALLENGILPEADPEEIPASWMISPEWKALVEESLDRPGGRTWYSLLHYGNMLFEHWDNAHTAPIAMHWPEKDKYEALAEKAWLESIDLAPNAWAYRNLAVLEHLRGNEEQAEAYYDKVFTFAVSKKDPAFAAEYMAWLSKAKKYEKAWKLYESLPEAIQTTDRMMLVAAKTGIRMRKLDFVKAVFEREYADIREGENSLTDLWFEYCALQMAKERGIENPDQETIQALCDEAWDTCPPPHAIDFRMSYDKKNGYRIQAD